MLFQSARLNKTGVFVGVSTHGLVMSQADMDKQISIDYDMAVSLGEHGNTCWLLHLHEFPVNQKEQNL